MDQPQAVAQDAERPLSRLTYPTIDPDTVLGEIIAATVDDVEQALTELGEGELDGLPAAGEMWTRGDAFRDAESTE